MLALCPGFGAVLPGWLTHTSAEDTAGAIVIFSKGRSHATFDMPTAAVTTAGLASGYDPNFPGPADAACLTSPAKMAAGPWSRRGCGSTAGEGPGVADDPFVGPAIRRRVFSRCNTWMEFEFGASHNSVNGHDHITGHDCMHGHDDING